jgi:hypothetical protein
MQPRQLGVNLQLFSRARENGGGREVTGDIATWHQSLSTVHPSAFCRQLVK